MRTRGGRGRDALLLHFGPERRSWQAFFVEEVHFGGVGPAVADSRGGRYLRAGDDDFIPLDDRLGGDKAAVRPGNGEPLEFAVFRYEATAEVGETQECAASSNNCRLAGLAVERGFCSLV